nr:MAG TPA: Fructokinase [Caudoviricetes sp.]
MKLKVHSLRIEHIRTYNDRDDDFEDNSKYILNCISENNLKYEVSLWTEYGSCPSGWCSASWGHCEVKLVDSFIGSTHKPIKDLSFEIEMEEGDLEDTIYNDENNIFHVDYNGGEYWYPCGEAGIAEELFTETNRTMDKRPVWIFKGNSGLGKSYIAGIIANSGRMKTVYETDAHEELNFIEADIIVVGNKYDHSIEEIEQKIKGEHETIVVDFSKKPISGKESEFD